MQIHELNTFLGTPDDTDFLAIDSGFDTAKISAKVLLQPIKDKETELSQKKVNIPLDEYNQPDNGEPGQVLRTNGDGSTKWVAAGLPTDEQTAQAISDWLSDHPEATTTVQDGSLSEAKFSNDLKTKTIKEYVTPEMFGAAGDGVTDDTDALEAAFAYMIANDITHLHLIKRYRITREVVAVIQQLKITGENTDPACIYCDGVNAKLVIGDGNTKLYAIIFRDFWIRGNHNNADSILTLRNCWNCYFTNFHVSDGGENIFLMHITDHSGIMFFNNCTIEGGSQVSLLPANRNGILVDTLGSIFVFKGGNVWNLDTFIQFNAWTNKVVISDSWIECVRSFCVYNVAAETDMRYTNISINNNAFSIHDYNEIVLSTVIFLQFIGSANTNFFSSSIDLTDNQIYLWGNSNSFGLSNNSLIDFIGGVKSGSRIAIKYSNNIYSGKTPGELNGYVYKNNLNLTRDELLFIVCDTIRSSEAAMITNSINLITALIPANNGEVPYSRGGINVNSDIPTDNQGRLYYYDGAMRYVDQYGESLIRKTAYVGVDLAAQEGFSASVDLPSGFTSAATMVVGIRITYNGAYRTGQSITTKEGARLFAELTGSNKVQVYNNDAALYGARAIIMLMKLF